MGAQVFHPEIDGVSLGSSVHPEVDRVTDQGLPARPCQYPEVMVESYHSMFIL